ncbi:Lrp/AsnC family transcriptional regulator [Paeniglutamicibacter cryotolerans]|uniref:DNA-binding Lrp family transcriptional regulator n=1 Tax=Paeniglutamicibacter cryotolerans TaxID=670079 RepID=A0A839QM18_9MICC|nr:Lrp/AsnC family transcriptional regulator [Paeniglutamicibacter cryotolerans]MBB2995056.1 DNA-binding Lrp family transcriptional regulator [Paeniglutamicibacter cryotolerans]
MKLDPLDASIIELMTDEPGIGVLESSRRLGVARGTVQNRLNRLQEAGVVARIALQINPGAMGYPIITYCSLEIHQEHGHEEVAPLLARIPEILEMHTVSGSSDMLVKIVARSTVDLQRVLDAVSQTAGVDRTSSSIVLVTHFENRTLPLVRDAGRE